MSPYAFEMGQNHPPMVVERVGADDARACNEFQLDRGGSAIAPTFVVAELDDVAVAFGASRMVDDTTAEITRIDVDPIGQAACEWGPRSWPNSKRAARADGATRLLLESTPRRLAAIELYEAFGFRRCPCWGKYAGSAESICLEKPLVE